MAALTNKLHVKQGSTVQECTSYTTATEATPNNGSYWEINNNGTTAYLPLSRTTDNSSYATPLHTTKNGTTYAVDTSVPQPLNINYYARDFVADYQTATALPAANIAELTNIKPDSDASFAFSGCQALTTTSGVESTWDTSNVTNMSRMFENCNNLTSVDTSHWDTSNVTDMSRMFAGSAISNSCFANLDTHNVTNAQGMFNWWSGGDVLDVSSLDFSNLTNASSMFEGTYKRLKLPSKIGQTGFSVSNSGIFGNLQNLEYLDTSNCEISMSRGSSYGIGSYANLKNVIVVDLSGFSSLYSLVISYWHSAANLIIIINRTNLRSWLISGQVELPTNPNKALLLVPASEISTITNYTTGGSMYHLYTYCAAIDAIENYNIVHDYANGAIGVTHK